MSQSSNVKKTPLKIDASASDVLIHMSSPVLLYLGVSAAAIGDAAFPCSQPFKIPKGTGAFVSAVADHAIVTASPLGATTTPAALIAQGFTMSGGTVAAATGDNVTLDTKVANASGTVNYKWYWSKGYGQPRIFIDPTDPGVPGGNPNASAKTDKLVNNGVTVASSGVYRCEATDADGSFAATEFILTVTP